VTAWILHPCQSLDDLLGGHAPRHRVAPPVTPPNRETAVLHCPWCRQGMREVQHAGVPFHRCGKCGVHWIDRRNLLAGEAPRAGRRTFDGPSCPSEGGPLIPHRRGEIEFWRCNRCEGILISEGNWNRMIGAPTLKAHREDTVESGNEAESDLPLVLRILTALVDD